MRYRIVIPARYGSTRLPGKPLLDVAGKPLLQRVWEQAKRSAAEEVVIATDDQRIADFASRVGMRAVMTSVDHHSGSDRINEVAETLGWDDDAIVVNLQGDEPLIPPALPDQVAANLFRDQAAAMATLCAPIGSRAALLDPHNVKVVFDSRHHALYFSRAPIPFDRDGMEEGVFGFRHIGLYAYRVGFLREFSRLPPCDLEQLEKLEQLRALWLGRVIHISVTELDPGPGIDTAEDLRQVAQIIAGRAA